MVFTSDKDGLRANIQRAGERELALDLKPEAPAHNLTPDVMLHARATIEQQRHQPTIMANVNQHHHGQRIGV